MVARRAGVDAVLVLGYALLGDASEATVAFIQTFAAGAILTMLADTMMPEAVEHAGPARRAAHRAGLRGGASSSARRLRAAAAGQGTCGSAPPAASIGLPAACQARMPPAMLATS